MHTLLARFAADETGAVTMEYSVIAGSIAVAIAALIGQIGGELHTSFEGVRPVIAAR